MKRLLPLPALCGALFASLAATPLYAAPTLLDTVDLSPGDDTGVPQSFTLNATTHKLYILDLNGLKVIDTTSGAATAGITLGALAGDPAYAGTFLPLWLATDGSSDAPGNKVYVVGFRNADQFTERLYLRVVDGATNTNLTTTASDLDLGVASGGGTNGVSAIVNPATHKVYVGTGSAVIVVDGPNRTVLSRLVTGVDTATVSAINRATGKLYFFSVYSSASMAIVDGATDTFTNAAVPFTSATAAVVDESTGRVYVYAHDRNSYAAAIYMLDANGTVLGSTGAGLDTSSGSAFASLGFDSSAHVLYVSNGEDAYPQPSVTALDASTLAVKTTYAGRSASSVVYDSGHAFLLNRKQFANAVGILTPATRAFTQTTVTYTPYALAVNRQTGRVFVADAKANEVTVVDATTRAVVNRFQVRATTVDPSRPSVIAVSATFNRFYLAHVEDVPVGGGGIFGGGTIPGLFLDVYDADSGTALASVSLGANPFNNSAGLIAVDDTHHRAYVTAGTTQADGTQSVGVAVVDLDANAVVSRLPAGGSNGIAVNPVTQRVYCTLGAGQGSVVILDGAANTVIATLSTVSPVPGNLAINTKTNTVYIANYGQGDPYDRNYVEIIDGATSTSLGTFDNTSQNRGDQAFNVAVDEDANTVFIADSGNGFVQTGVVTAFDAGNHYAFLGQVQAGNIPTGLVFEPGTRRVFAANDADGTLTVVQASAAPAGSGHPAFFNGEVALSNGVYYLQFPSGNPFGYYSYLADSHYVYHFDLGYEYVFDANDSRSGVYLYDFKSGDFFYTSPAFPFPYLYDFKLNSTLYYYADPNNPGRYNTNGVRYFYSFATKQIISR